MADRFHGKFHLTGATPANGTLVSGNGSALLHTVTICTNTAVAATVALYDSNQTSSAQQAANLISSVSLPAVIGPPVTLVLDETCATGLVLVATGTGLDCNISFS